MSFDVTADAYARFMGVYAEPFAVQFVGFADVRAGQRALDVGCGPGALTNQLVGRLGAVEVAAIDPAATFVAANRLRFPEVDVRSGVAEQLPFADDSFDGALAQLVVHFMADPVAGLQEMARVTAPAAWWQRASGTTPETVVPFPPFWRAVHDIDPAAKGEAHLAGAREGHLVELFEAAGLHQVEPATLTVRVPFATFADWWEPFTLGVGPAGAYVAQLSDPRLDLLRARCAQCLPPAPFEVRASAWCVRGRV